MERPMSATVVLSTVYFARYDGAPPEPVPYYLTAEELVRFVRLDAAGTKDPERTLAHYRKLGVLKGVQIGNNIRYMLPDAIEFGERLKAVNPV